MKPHVWGSSLLVLMVTVLTGCSGGDSPAPTAGPAAPSISGGAKAVDTVTPPSNALTGEESGLMNAGESQPGPVQMPPPG